MQFHVLNNHNRKSIKLSQPGDYIYFLFNQNGHYKFEISTLNISVHIFGLYYGGDNDKFESTITQHHHSPNTSSHLHLRSAMKDRATFKYHGLIRIDNKASQASAYQTNHNLLLSPEAQITSIPSLEILNKNVKCSHSASTSEPTQEAIHYLCSRGLNRDQAYDLYKTGFLKEIFNQITNIVIKKSPDSLEDVLLKLKYYKDKILNI